MAIFFLTRQSVSGKRLSDYAMTFYVLIDTEFLISQHLLKIDERIKEGTLFDSFEELDHVIKDTIEFIHPTRGVQYVMKTAKYIPKFYMYTLHNYFY